MKSSTRCVALLALALAATELTGCAVAVVGGAAAAGSVVATDRRSSATQLADQGIELRASSAVNDAHRQPGGPQVLRPPLVPLRCVPLLERLDGQRVWPHIRGREVLRAQLMRAVYKICPQRRAPRLLDRSFSH